MFYPVHLLVFAARGRFFGVHHSAEFRPTRLRIETIIYLLVFAASFSLPSFGTSVFVDSTGLTFRPSLFPLLFGGSFLASFAGQN